MKRWMLTAPETLVLEETPDPEPGDGEVVVRVAASTVCGTEAHVYRGHLRRDYPIEMPGGEYAGEVVAVGPGVTRARPGDRVAVAALPLVCGDCEACRLGHPNFCRAGTGGAWLYGGYSELARVPQAAVDALPEDLPYLVAALTEPMTCALRAMRRSPPRGVDLAVIVGVGGMGMLLGLALRRDTNATLVAADIAPAKLALARELFADETVDLRSQEIAESVRRVRQPGADVVFECAGREESLAAALRAARIGGTVNLVSIFTAPVALDLYRFLHARELTLLGSKGPYPYRWEGAPEAFHYLRDARASRVITHQVPFEETPGALQLAGSPDAVKVAIVRDPAGRPGGQAE
jgi:threonine dehydrogenase-like Zn-dependent dehydrogenase